MRVIACCGLLIAAVAQSLFYRAELRAVELHEDYYIGFSQERTTA